MQSLPDSLLPKTEASLASVHFYYTKTTTYRLSLTSFVKVLRDKLSFLLNKSDNLSRKTFAKLVSEKFYEISCRFCEVKSRWLN